MSEGIRKFGTKSTAVDGSNCTIDAQNLEDMDVGFLNLDVAMDVEFLNDFFDSLKDTMVWGYRGNELRDLMHLQEQHDRLESEHYAKIHCIQTQILCDVQAGCLKRAELLQKRGSTWDRKFWHWLMKLLREVRLGIAVEDEDALSYLTDIRWSRTDDLKGNKLEFVFNSNPYFENHVLTKTIHFKMLRGQRIIDKTTGTEINWRKDKCLAENDKSFFKLFMADDLYAYHFFLKHDHVVDFWQAIVNRAVLHTNSIHNAACAIEVGGLSRLSGEPDLLKILLLTDTLFLAQEEINRIVAHHLRNIREEEASYWKSVANIHEKRGEIVSKYFVYRGEEDMAMLGHYPFWLNAMRGLTAEETLDPLITVDDEKALGYLKNIKLSYDACDDGAVVWQLDFFFNPNPYFRYSVLTKVLHFYYSEGSVLFVKNMGTKIEWLLNCFLPREESFFNLFDSFLKTEGYERGRPQHKICGAIINKIVGHAASFYWDHLSF